MSLPGGVSGARGAAANRGRLRPVVATAEVRTVGGGNARGRAPLRLLVKAHRASRGPRAGADGPLAKRKATSAAKAAPTEVPGGGRTRDCGASSRVRANGCAEQARGNRRTHLAVIGDEDARPVRSGGAFTGEKGGELSPGRLPRPGRAPTDQSGNVSWTASPGISSRSGAGNSPRACRRPPCPSVSGVW